MDGKILLSWSPPGVYRTTLVDTDKYEQLLPGVEYDTREDGEENEEEIENEENVEVDTREDYEEK